MRKDDLRTIEGAIAAVDANFGSQIPADMRRYIYRIKVINEQAGVQLFTLGKRENGAGATSVVDVVQNVFQYDLYADPEELLEDAAPLYIIEGTGAVGTSFIRAFTDVGPAYLTIWYIDAPSID